MTLSDLLADSYRRLNFASDTFANASAAQAGIRLIQFANECHRQILTLPGLDSLRDETTTVATIASTARSALGLSVSRIRGIQDRTNQRPLKEITLDELRRRDPGRVATGNPWGYAVFGTMPVLRQPAATGVWAASTSAADTGAGFKANVQAIRTGGYLHTPAATNLTGTSRVAIGSLTDYTEITRFYLSAVCAGDVTLYDAAAAGNVLAVIPIGQTQARYLILEWMPIPAAVQTFYVDYTRVIPDLALANDEPLLPLDFHWVIGVGMRMKEYEKTNDSRFSTAKAEYDDGIKAIRNWAQSDGSLLVSLRANPPGLGWSRLGGWYPSDLGGIGG